MSTPTRPPRLASLDVLRGLDVLLMLFVNEMAGVKGTPLFLRHARRDDDLMTLTDVVFPAFLFIVGTAIPLALGTRLSRGESRASLLRHVALRTFGLLVMGVFMLNAEEAGPGQLMPAPVWNILVTLCLVLVWGARYEGAKARGTQGALRAAGFVGLVALALVYRHEGEGGTLLQLHHSWWGILGLIGWSYMVGAAAYITLGERPSALAGLVGLLYCVYLADAAGNAPFLRTFSSFLSVGSMLGAHGAIVVSGVLLGCAIVGNRKAGADKEAVARFAFGQAAVFALAALLLHTLHNLHSAFHFSKILATPPWCLMSSALTAAAFGLVYVVSDCWGFKGWGGTVFMAGENALLAYLVAPLLLSLFDLSALLLKGYNFYEALSEPFALGTLRSILFAFLVVRLCGVLRAAGVALQL